MCYRERKACTLSQRVKFRILDSIGESKARMQSAWTSSIFFLLLNTLHRYYALPITIFKSTIDDQLFNLLWATHWTSTLLTSSLIEVGAMITNLNCLSMIKYSMIIIIRSTVAMVTVQYCLVIDGTRHN